MQKKILILGVVTAASIVAAALGHAYCREFCMLFKPVTWPFIALGVILVNSLRKNRKESK